MFKSDHPYKPVRFGKFSDLRHKECVLAGASRTHGVCVCNKHQHVKLMREMGKDVLNDNPIAENICHCRPNGLSPVQSTNSRLLRGGHNA